MTDQVLDMRLKLCPLPVIKTQQAIASMGPGEVLTVICTDPGATHDIPAWCRVHGHELVSIETTDDEFYIRVACQST